MKKTRTRITRKPWLQNNQRGVTILEIIVAVAILAVISIPIARAIVLSSKYQYISRERQRLTNVSESLMEVFKSFSLEEMAEKYQEENYSGWLFGCEVDSNTSFTVEDNTEFAIKNVLVEGKVYDITATALPVADYDKVDVTFMKDFDSVTCAYALIEEGQQDATSAIKRDFEINYANDFITSLNELEKVFVKEKALTVDDIDYSFINLKERVIDIYAQKSGSKYNLYYDISYSYEMKQYPYNADEEGTKEYFDYGEFEVKEISGQTFFAKEGNENELLNRVYVYYYPVYVDRNGGSIIDKMEFSNNCGSELELYLLKQSDPGLGVGIEAYEESYCPNVIGSGGSTRIYHNLDRNDYYLSRISGFTNGSGENIEKAIQKNDETFLYTVDIVVTKDGEECARLSSTLKK